MAAQQPERSTGPPEPEASSNRNFWYHVFEGALYGLGTSLVSGSEVLPVLIVDRLGASNTTLGLFTTLAGLSFLVPVFLAPRVEAVRRKKRFVAVTGVLVRLPYLLIALSLLLFASSHPHLCVLAIGGCIMTMSVLMAAQMPPWMDLVAETIPDHRRGRLFGYRMSLSSVAGLVAGPACGAVLATLAFPGNYAMLYGLCFVLLMLSWFIFLRVEEIPEHAAPPGRQRAAHYFRDLVVAVRRDREYRNYLIYRACRRVSWAALPFFAVVARKYHGLNEALAVTLLLVSSRLARVLGTLIGPRIAERFGHRRVIQVGLVLGAARAMAIAVIPQGWWPLFFGAYFLGGLGQSAGSVSGMAYQLRVYPRGRRVGYTTVTMVALGPLAMAAAPAAGAVMDTVGHPVLFSVVGALLLLALLPVQRFTARGDRSP